MSSLDPLNNTMVRIHGLPACLNETMERIHLPATRIHPRIQATNGIMGHANAIHGCVFQPVGVLEFSHG